MYKINATLVIFYNNSEITVLTSYVDFRAEKFERSKKPFSSCFLNTMNNVTVNGKKW